MKYRQFEAEHASQQGKGGKNGSDQKTIDGFLEFLVKNEEKSGYSTFEMQNTSAIGNIGCCESS